MSMLTGDTIPTIRGISDSTVRDLIESANQYINGHDPNPARFCSLLEQIEANMIDSTRLPRHRAAETSTAILGELPADLTAFDRERAWTAPMEDSVAPVLAPALDLNRPADRLLPENPGTACPDPTPILRDDFAATLDSWSGNRHAAI